MKLITAIRRVTEFAFTSLSDTSSADLISNRIHLKVGVNESVWLQAFFLQTGSGFLHLRTFRMPHPDCPARPRVPDYESSPVP